MVAGVRTLQDNMFGITPGSLPFYRSRWVRQWNDARLRKTLQQAASSLGLSPYIFWAFLPTAAGLAGTMGEILTIYHCVDDYASNPGVDSQVIAEMERRILEKADLVFTTSVTLQRSLEKYHSHVVLLPVGVDDIFLTAATLPEPKDLSQIPKPRIAFTGAISSYKVNIDLLVQAASVYPEVSFVLIGPVGAGDPSTRVSELRKMHNVYLLGSREHRRLPEYLMSMDILMLPSAHTPTMRSSFPAKLFEYFATGKPVIAVKQETLLPYHALMTLADSPEAFLDAIPKALQEKDQSKADARIELARQNVWHRRIEQISADIESALIRKHGGQR
jgi:glycosyltransferase involved in cell wall biosynthesis